MDCAGNELSASRSDVKVVVALEPDDPMERLRALRAADEKLADWLSEAVASTPRGVSYQVARRSTDTGAPGSGSGDPTGHAPNPARSPTLDIGRLGWVSCGSP